MLISLSNGDLDADPPSEAPCLVGIQGSMGYLLFSIETQSTIGFGSRQITRHCPEAILLMVVQLIFGSGLCGALVSIVYAKMISPNRFRPRSSFSKSAVVRSFKDYRNPSDSTLADLSARWSLVSHVQSKR